MSKKTTILTIELEKNALKVTTMPEATDIMLTAAIKILIYQVVGNHLELPGETSYEKIDIYTKELADSFKNLPGYNEKIN
jgi:hypothetical protein